MSLSFAPFDWREGLSAQRKLFSESFPENVGLPVETEAYYHRKFRSYPAEIPCQEYVAEDESGFVGYYAALPFTYLVEGETFRCGMVCDVMTSPRMQGKGVFTKLGAYSLAQITEAGFDFVTGYPRRAAVIPGHLKVGWQIAFRLPMYLLPIKADGVLGTKGFGWMAGLINPCLWVMQRLLGLRGAGGYVHEIWDWKAFLGAHDFSAFVADWASTRKVTLEKTPEFLHWRLSIQEVDYRVVTVKRGNELVGISIVRACNPEQVPSLAVLDLMCIGEDRRILRAMRRGWLELAGRWGREVVVMMLSEYHAAKMRLWRLGFLRTPTVFSFILKRLSPKAQAKLPIGPEAWHLMWIDSDDL